MSDYKIVVHLIRCAFECDEVTAQYTLADKLSPPGAEAVYDAIKDKLPVIAEYAAKLERARQEAAEDARRERAAQQSELALLGTNKRKRLSIHVAQAMLRAAHNHEDFTCHLRGTHLRVSSANTKKLHHIQQICGLPVQAASVDGCYYYVYHIGEPPC